jgi:hypothetical protein
LKQIIHPNFLMIGKQATYFTFFENIHKCFKDDINTFICIFINNEYKNVSELKLRIRVIENVKSYVHGNNFIY